MTSSKKAKKPSSSFKKAYGNDYNPGADGLDEKSRESQENLRNMGSTGRQMAGEQAVKAYNKRTKEQKTAANKQGEATSTSYTQGPAVTMANVPGSMKTVTGVATATPKERGVAAPGTMQNGQTDIAGGEAVNPRSQRAVQSAASDTAAERVNEEVKDPNVVQRVETNKEDAEKKKEEAAQKEKDDAAAAEKKRHDDYINDYMTKKKQENTIGGGAPLDEDQLRQEAEEEFQKWDAEMKQNASDDEERKRIAKEKFDELVKEKSAKGERFDTKELKKEAEAFADGEMAKKKNPQQQEGEVKHDPETIKDRSALLQKNLDWLGDTFNAAGKAGELINKGLDILGGVLKAALNPSPLGLNEAQTMLSTTAEAFNLANELVGTLTKKGEELAGKKIVTKMAESMGSIIDSQFGGKDMSQMTPEELDRFNDQLTRAWAPFMDRLERIGADNPTGKMLANKFINTFKSINTQAKSNKENIRLEKKRDERNIRDMKSAVEKKRFKTTEDVINFTKQYHVDLLNPNSGVYDPDAAKALEVLNEQLGRDASNLPYELTHDQHGNSIIDDNYYAVLLDKKLHRYNPYTRKFEMTPQAAQAVAKRIMGMRVNNDPEYLNDKDRYDRVLQNVLRTTVGTNEGMNDARAEEKHRQHMEGRRTPIERVSGAKTLSDRNYIRKLIDQGQTLGEIFPTTLRKDILNAAGADIIKYERILSQNGFLTQDERNAYNIAKNTQDLVLFIDDVENMKKMISTYRDKAGDDWLDENGNTVINPRTNRPYKVSEVYDYDFLNKQMNDVQRIMNEVILATPLRHSDTNMNGDVQRVHTLQVSNGQSDSVRQRLLDIQHMFPGMNIVKEPGAKYVERIGMGDITQAIYDSAERNEDNLVDFAFIVTQGLDMLDEDIKAFDANSGVRSGVLSGMLGVMSGRLRSINKVLKSNPNALDNKDVVDAIDRMSQSMTIGLNTLSSDMRKVDTDLGKKLDSLKKVGDEAIDAIKKGDPNAEKLVQKFVQMNDAIVVKLDEESINELRGGGGGGGGPAPPPAGEKRTIPSWFDQSMSAPAGNQWMSHMMNEYNVSNPRDPTKWPVDKYWDIQNDLLSLIENTSDRGDKAALRNIAQRAFRQGMFGSIKVDPRDTSRFYVDTSVGGPTPLVDLTVNNDGYVYTKNGKRYTYTDPRGNAVELRAEDYNRFLENLWKMDQDEAVSRLDSQTNLDLSKDATSAAGGEKYMRALVKLFAPLM